MNGRKQGGREGRGNEEVERRRRRKWEMVEGEREGRGKRGEMTERERK